LPVRVFSLAIDIDRAEATRLRQKQQQELKDYIAAQTKKLADDNFLKMRRRKLWSRKELNCARPKISYLS
jgi:hypothetical protein